MGTWPACLTCRYEGSRVSEQLRVVFTFLFNVGPQLTATWVSSELTYGEIPEPACGSGHHSSCMGDGTKQRHDLWPLQLTQKPYSMQCISEYGLEAPAN